jgi:hypothetical protein
LLFFIFNIADKAIDKYEIFLFSSIDVYNCISRKTQISCSSDCYTSSCSWKPSNYYWHLFNYQAVFCTKLLPRCKDCAHVLYGARSDIHPWN